ncbi:hypothetical protein [Pelagibacterium lacus]|uniref:Uncharacterized protein n=1 Tax=Pelagibacterium lacus TaxID=2282655 RepID=A0A369W4G9_9HYPH|nr:hypothetical protein [Pelagibacterium lacus]RDE08765.1 hypothetical protein DVH29_10005 [Pelagibacterium lacus]
MKSYVKLASGLMFSGMGAIALERMAANGLARNAMHLPEGMGWLLSGFILIPFALIAAGVLVYIAGAILGLK